MGQPLLSLATVIRWISWYNLLSLATFIQLISWDHYFLSLSTVIQWISWDHPLLSLGTLFQLISWDHPLFSLATLIQLISWDHRLFSLATGIQKFQHLHQTSTKAAELWRYIFCYTNTDVSVKHSVSVAVSYCIMYTDGCGDGLHSTVVTYDRRHAVIKAVYLPALPQYVAVQLCKVWCISGSAATVRSSAAV